ncbi:MAG TPA: hypothetical protein VGC41_04465, partial [Kofleriaceae bacterium]
IAPWFDELPFYPQLADTPFERTDLVRLQSVAATLAQIDNHRRQPQLDTMRAALLVWQPLRAQAIAAAMHLDAPDSRDRISALAAARFRAGTPTTRRANDTARFIELLVRGPDGREREHVARVVAQYVSAHGVPGSPEHEARFREEHAAVAAPLHVDLRRVVVERLKTLPRSGGVEPDRVLAPVTVDEAARFHVPVGAPLPVYLEPKVARSCDADLEQLVDRGVIASGEVFAQVLPQVTQQVRGATLEPTAAVLYAQLYLAFRRRRGLLLLDYQSQVRFTELPWAAALDDARAKNADATSRARKAIARSLASALRAFPETLIPNKLVTELYSLADAAELKLPFVEEIAADIFMGGFTTKFVHAAKRAAGVVAGTLYERYYAIDTHAIANLPVDGKTSPELAAMCRARAQPLTKGSVAESGKVLEHAQILTTHNLAVLFDALPLADQLGARLRTLAERCFLFAVKRIAMRTRNYHQVLINVKNAAYAWRQMVFYLSFDTDLREFLGWANQQLVRFPDEIQTRMRPAMLGLSLARNVRSDSPEFANTGARVFTGWSTERHWLAPHQDV